MMVKGLSTFKKSAIISKECLTPLLAIKKNGLCNIDFNRRPGSITSNNSSNVPSGYKDSSEKDVEEIDDFDIDVDS